MLRAWLMQWCKRWSSAKTYRKSKPSIEQRRRLSLHLEQLEDRITPSGLQILPLTLAPDTAGAGYSATVKATGGDGHYGYTITSGALPSGISLSSSGVLSGKATVAGTYSFTVKVTDTTLPGLTASQTEMLTVTPGAVASFALSAPSTVSAGSAFGVTVTAKDAFGNTVTGYKGSATLASSDGQKVVGTQTVSLANGMGTASITLDTADKVTLTASTGSIKGTSGSITVIPGTLATFLVSSPSSATAGTGFQVTVTAKDAEGNTITGFSGALTLTSSDGQKVSLAAAPTFSGGMATATVTLNTAGTLTLTASSGAFHGTGGTITVKSATPSDWFSQNLPDAGLQALARSDFTRDNTLTYSDMLGLFAEVETKGPVTAAEMQSLQALVSQTGTTALKLTPDVQSLATKVIDGDPANATYQGQALGNLKVVSTATQLQLLVNKWFLGADHPTIDTQYTGSTSYALASGTLFGSGGPSYQDVAQGAEGDCWLLSSFGVTAANDPSVIKSMFIYDSTNMENGVAVQVWTVRFYQNGVATYLTVDNYLPASGGYLDFADMGHAANSSQNILWVPLAEKAYAQLSADGWNQRPQANAYSSLNGGWAASALPVITGHADNGTSSMVSASSLINALASGSLITVGSIGNVPALGIVGGHDYAVLGYNASNQTFTLLNPWGWNSNYWYDGYQAAGVLHLTWAQLSQYYYLDGNCNPFHAAAGAQTAVASSQSGEGMGGSSVGTFASFNDMSLWQQAAAMLQANHDAAG
jgi:hypothetical protein